MMSTAFSQRYQSGFIRPSGMTSGMLASGIGGIGGETVAISIPQRRCLHVAADHGDVHLIGKAELQLHALRTAQAQIVDADIR
jgi:hypothetical protein